MYMGRHYTSYHKYFSLLGVSLYNPECVLRSYAKVSLYVFVVISTAAPGYSVLQLVSNERMFTYFGPMEIIILNIAAVSDAARSALLPIHAHRYKSLFERIWLLHRDLDAFFDVHLGHQLPHRTYSKQYLLKVGMVLGGYVLMIIGYIAKNVATGDVAKLSIVKRVLQWSSAIGTIYVAYYIDILSFYLSQLNAVIARDVAGYIGDSLDVNKLFIVDKLKNYKIVHFRLWLLGQWLNEIFGWHILLLVLNAYADCVYSAFWLFEEVNRDNGIFATLRKLPSATSDFHSVLCRYRLADAHSNSNTRSKANIFLSPPSSLSMQNQWTFSYAPV